MYSLLIKQVKGEVGTSASVQRCLTHVS